jgi:sn-glycerol 3-phosphate transport system ATP-binding protein
VRQDGFSKSQPGDDIRIAWDSGFEHRFEKTSERRMDSVAGDLKRAAAV